MSTNSIALGTTRAGCTMSAMRCRRGSGTGTTPVFGSMVQNGKFSALTAAWVMALNSVDLPTFGSPTMPQLKPIASAQAAGACSAFIARCMSPCSRASSTASGSAAAASAAWASSAGMAAPVR